MTRMIFGLLATIITTTATYAGDRSTSTGDEARPPRGWIGYCAENPQECNVTPSAPLDVDLTPEKLHELAAFSKRINNSVIPMTDQEHFGMNEKWTLPTDGYGDCEDYALLKQKLLIEAGWPRQALLITVVRDQLGRGHAVLTIKSNQGDYILDNQTDTVDLWTDTGYKFAIRQSQSSPNVWVKINPPELPGPVASKATKH